jgi:hypothetical protein
MTLALSPGAGLLLPVNSTATANYQGVTTLRSLWATVSLETTRYYSHAQSCCQHCFNMERGANGTLLDCQCGSCIICLVPGRYSSSLDPTRDYSYMNTSVVLNQSQVLLQPKDKVRRRAAWCAQHMILTSHLLCMSVMCSQVIRHLPEPNPKLPAFQQGLLAWGKPPALMLLGQVGSCIPVNVRSLRWITCPASNITTRTS